MAWRASVVEPGGLPGERQTGLLPGAGRALAAQLRQGWLSSALGASTLTAIRCPVCLPRT